MKKLAVITGARRGIGLAIAKKLGELGYSLLLCATSPEADDALEFFRALELTPTQEAIAHEVLKEIRQRLAFLSDVDFVPVGE